MDDRPFYYRLRGRTIGPVGLRQIRQLAQRAQIGRMTDVSRDGIQWSKAGDFPEVFEATGAEPPVNAGGGGGGGSLISSGGRDGSGNTIGGGDTFPPPQVTNWYYTLNGEQQGPVDLATLQQLVAMGQVATTEHAIPEGGAQWKPISSLPQFVGTGGPIIVMDRHPREPAQPEGSNGMAIAGFVLALLGCGPLGLILSLVALNSKNKANRGLAIAGAIIGGVFTLCGCGYAVILIIAAVANA